MKKILMITLALAVAGLVKGDIQPLEGSNAVGFSAVAAAAGDDQIITVPFVACLDNDSAVFLADLVSTNGLVAHASDPASADQLIVMTFNSGLGKLVYYYYWLDNAAGWTAIETTLVEDGSTTVITPPAAGAFDVARGLGFWLKRVATSENDVYVKGEVSGSNPSTAIVEGLNLIGYGTAAELNLNAVSWTGAFGNSTTGNTADSDKIIVINSDGSMQEYFFFECPAGWPQAYLDLDGMWVKSNYTLPSVNVTAGQGFWYLRRGTGSFDFKPDGN